MIGTSVCDSAVPAMVKPSASPLPLSKTPATAVVQTVDLIIVENSPKVSHSATHCPGAPLSKPKPQIAQVVSTMPGSASLRVPKRSISAP